MKEVKDLQQKYVDGRINRRDFIKAVGALGIAVLMVAALLTHLRLKSPPPKMLPSISLLCACLAIAYVSTQLLLAA